MADPAPKQRPSNLSKKSPSQAKPRSQSQFQQQPQSQSQSQPQSQSQFQPQQPQLPPGSQAQIFGPPNNNSQWPAPSQQGLSVKSSAAVAPPPGGYGVGDIPSMLLRGGPSKFGNWKKKSTVESNTVQFDDGEGEDQECHCNPCLCTTPPDDVPSERKLEREESAAGEPEPTYNLNNFARAKQFFMTSSTKTGISLYDHFAELIRKLLDNRAPEDPVDYVEEMSLNLKRYRFGMTKDLVQDAYYFSKRAINDAEGKIKTWKRHALWSAEQTASEMRGEESTFGGFPNLLRLQYYLEHANIGLPREEMFKIALVLRQIKLSNPVTRVRFWGKIYGIQGNYIIFEAEIPDGQLLSNVWNSSPESPAPETTATRFTAEDASQDVPGAVDTFEKAGKAVTNPEVFTAYQYNSTRQNTSEPQPESDGLLNEFAGESVGPLGLADTTDPEEIQRWLNYQEELMQGIPTGKVEEPVIIPTEEPGKGANRRVFFVLPEKTSNSARQRAIDDPENWASIVNPTALVESDSPPEDVQAPFVLPPVTPQQINVSRRIRWYLTGDLNGKIVSEPPFPGREGHYLHALLVRITAGTAVSPRGYYRTKKYGPEDGGEGEEEDEEELGEEEEEEERPKDDIVYPNKKFRYPNIAGLASKDVELWVHHAAYLLRQGRIEWFNPHKPKDKPKKVEEDEEEEEEEEELGEEEEEEEDDGTADKEMSPKLFSSLTEDKSLDPSAPPPWTARASSTIFTEFQVANVRSNIWPGANAICTQKGKVENIYLGDGLKFTSRTYSPFVAGEPQAEYKDGPELTEILDPTVEEEQAWLAKLQLQEIADVEEKFVDNEDEDEGEGDDEEEE